MAAVVPAESIPNAISVVTVVQMAGEVLAPLLFALVSGSPSLAPAFLLAALAYAPAALLPPRGRSSGRLPRPSGRRSGPPPSPRSSPAFPPDPPLPPRP